MTRKDYTGMVEAIAKGTAQGDVLKSVKQWLREDNQKFNEQKFDDYLKKCMEKYV